MKNVKRLLAALTIAAAAIPGTSAQEFFDMSSPDRLFTIGARFDLNTSVRTVATRDFNKAYNRDNWGLGFDAGVVANINLFDALSLQPGLFIGMRQGSYAYYSGILQSGEGLLQLGDNKRCVMTVPVLVGAHFNLSQLFRWDLDFGPYVMFNIGDSDSVKIQPESLSSTERAARTDFGFKMGTGLTYKHRYSVAIHYMSGAVAAWNDGLRGRNKAWTFTLGYDF